MSSHSLKAETKYMSFTIFLRLKVEKVVYVRTFTVPTPHLKANLRIVECRLGVLDNVEFFCELLFLSPGCGGIKVRHEIAVVPVIFKLSMDATHYCKK
jgi:hypothetical protein